MLFIFISFIILASVIFALWEIQIEGESGWAEKLPCWQIKEGLIVKIMGGRPLTGYHAAMISFLVVIIHLPVIFTGFSLQMEFLLFGFLAGTLLVEDFLWFVFNPAYGLKRFKKGEIWWHKNWLGPVPIEYWGYLAITILLIWLGRPAL